MIIFKSKGEFFTKPRRFVGFWDVNQVELNLGKRS